MFTWFKLLLCDTKSLLNQCEDDKYTSSDTLGVDLDQMKCD
jgi:hypothetical protein